VTALARALLADIEHDQEELQELARLLAPLLAAIAAPAADEDRWMTTKGAAEYLGISPNALHKLTAKRAVPFAHDARGGKCWFLRSELDAWRRGQR
jgi:excisionase family DNA binding protein